MDGHPGMPIHVAYGHVVWGNRRNLRVPSRTLADMSSRVTEGILAASLAQDDKGDAGCGKEGVFDRRDQGDLRDSSGRPFSFPADGGRPAAAPPA
ncbi:protein of unknown function [Streptomyces sp. KY75]|nr:protein of unknown function [Streptomyces sp. KY75]